MQNPDSVAETTEPGFFVGQTFLSVLQTSLEAGQAGMSVPPHSLHIYIVDAERLGNVMSSVARNWIRTVCPANELRLYGPRKTYTPAVPLF